jgi:uncharacterized protein (UPF0248 family)
MLANTLHQESISSCVESEGVARISKEQNSSYVTIKGGNKQIPAHRVFSVAAGCHGEYTHFKMAVLLGWVKYQCTR